jgi:hypothetical protein
MVARWGSGRRERPGRGCGAAGGGCNAVRTGAHRCRVPLVDDQDAVEEFATQAADEALGDRVGPWCPHRCSDDVDADGGEDGVEPGGESRVAVPDEKPEAVAGVVEVDEQVVGRLGQPGAGRVGGDPEDVHPAGGVLDDEECVEPAQGDRLQMQ